MITIQSIVTVFSRSLKDEFDYYSLLIELHIFEFFFATEPFFAKEP